MLTTSLCLIQGVLYELLRGFMFAVLFLSVLLIATCGRLSWPALWTTFGHTLQNFFVIIVSCILSTCSMSAWHQCEASTWRHDANFATVVWGCCRSCHCRFRRPCATDVVPAGTGACLSLSSSSLLLLLLLLSTRGCRDSIWAPTEWLTTQETAGDCMRRCRIVTNRI